MKVDILEIALHVEYFMALKFGKRTKKGLMLLIRLAYCSSRQSIRLAAA